MKKFYRRDEIYAFCKNAVYLQKRAFCFDRRRNLVIFAVRNFIFCGKRNLNFCGVKFHSAKLSSVGFHDAEFYLLKFHQKKFLLIGLISIFFSLVFFCKSLAASFFTSLSLLKASTRALY